MAKYLDRIFDMMHRPNEMRSIQKPDPEYFPYEMNNWLIRSFILYTHHEVVGNVSEG